MGEDPHEIRRARALLLRAGFVVPDHRASQEEIAAESWRQECQDVLEQHLGWLERTMAPEPTVLVRESVELRLSHYDLAWDRRQGRIKLLQFTNQDLPDGEQEIIKCWGGIFEITHEVLRHSSPEEIGRSLAHAVLLTLEGHYPNTGGLAVAPIGAPYQLIPRENWSSWQLDLACCKTCRPWLALKSLRELRGG